MMAYQYTADGYYAGAADDYGLLPNNATHTPPPDVPDGYAARWTSETWELVTDHRGREGYVDGQPITIKEYGPLPDGWSDTPPPPAPPSRDEAYTTAQTSIRDAADAAMASLAAEYGTIERQTWDQQAAEADALLAEADAPAPLVRSIATARGMDPLDLAQRIAGNRAAWIAISGHIVGQRLRYQDALDAAMTLTDDAEAVAVMQAIVPVYTMPS